MSPTNVISIFFCQIVGLTFPAIAESSIGDFSFLIFAVIVVILFAFLWMYLPETKGRPVEEVADQLG